MRYKLLRGNICNGLLIVLSRIEIWPEIVRYRQRLSLLIVLSRIEMRKQTRDAEGRIIF